MSTRTLVGLFALLLGLTFCLLFCARTWDRPETFYSTLADAEQDGAIARGWIPAWLPKEARSLHELHDLDTNEVLLRWEVSGTPNMAPPGICRAIHPEATAPPRLTAVWWPEWHTIQADFALYECTDERAVGTLGIDRRHGISVYW